MSRETLPGSTPTGRPEVKILRSLDLPSRTELHSRYDREAGLGSYDEPLGVNK